ncbi:flagellar basal body rod C-terminal domain-containing protein [Sphingomonas adhaesiva]|uniref:flagellar basal body rod C-terminal domain-containing protein n=1 Tax=Sphingomonas adhaesiva TaxID=28212 RepID=UPI002FF5DB9D
MMPSEQVTPVSPWAAGAVTQTGNAWDVATGGAGVLMFRTDDGFHAATSAQLRRDGDGRLVDAGGGAIQAAGGGDIVVGAGAPTILRDGTIVIAGQAVGRIGVFAAPDDAAGVMRGGVPDEIADPVVRQGYVVPSQVDTATEMVELTRAGRLAETGAKVFQIYDDLAGRVAARLGEIGR